MPETKSYLEFAECNVRESDERVTPRLELVAVFDNRGDQRTASKARELLAALTETLLAAKHYREIARRAASSA